MSNNTKALQKHAAANGEKSKSKRCAEKFFGSYFFRYTAIYLVLSAIIFTQFLFFRKSLVWDPDGIAQHYTGFVYYGVYLRKIFKSLLAGHLVIPQFDLSIGMGNDIFTSLHYYGIGDPLNLISALVPSKYAAFAFSLLTYLRYYLAGLAFVLLAKYKKQSKTGACAGAMIYIFSAYAMYMTLRHPSFINPLIYFPLIILGGEMMFDGKRPYLFIISVCLAAVSGFYFFYVISIFTILYVFLRIFFAYPKDKLLKGFFQALFKFGGSYLLGMIMAAVTLLPMIITVLFSNRGSVQHALNPFYASEYYKEFIGAFMGYVQLDCNVYMGFTAAGAAAVVLLFMQKKKHGFLKAAFITATLLMMFPICSKVINGFSYVCNRWSWIYGLIAAYAFTVSISEIKKITFKKSVVLCAAAAVTTVIISLVPNARIKENYISCALFAFFAIACLIYSALPYVEKTDTKKAAKVAKAALCMIAAAGVIFNSLFIYDYNHASFSTTFLTMGQANRFSGSNSYKAIAELQNTESAVERYGGSGIELEQMNNSMLSGAYSSAGYLSLTDPSTNNFQKEMGLVYNNFSILDDSHADPYIYALENVKYYVSGGDEKKESAIGSESLATLKNISSERTYNSQVYENKDYIPFGFTYENVISQSEYSSLSPVQKREALLQAAVLNDTDEYVNSDLSSISTDVYKPEYKTVLPENGCIIKDNTIYSQNSGTEIHLKTSVPEGYQTYIQFNNLNYTSLSGMQLKKIISPDAYNKLTTYERRKISYNEKNFEPSTYASAIVSSDSGARTPFSISTPNHDYYSGINDFTVNLGDKPIKDITLRVGSGAYAYDSIEIICIPKTDYKANLNALAEEHLEDLNIAVNEISGSIKLESNKVLFLSIPYNENWTAYVDGEETAICRANTGFCAIPLKAGEHKIVLKYKNKQLKLSSAVSVVGFAGFAVTVAAVEISRKKKKSATIK